ncbi:MAG: class I SAM-dependent RNA methyltransferase [Bellilinea sp.]|jgi:23S rRNA (uracil1939-C5)-methyltransferase
MQKQARSVQVELTRYAYGGSGMGRLPDGRVVFVPFGLAGEVVRAELVEEKKGYARARLVEVLQPAAERIPPRCSHFGECGGCHYQNLNYPHQLRIKTGILREQIERIAGIANPAVEMMRPSPKVWNYRNTVQFHLDGQGKPGYERSGGRGVLAIEECHLPEPALDDFWRRLDFYPDRVGVEYPGSAVKRVGLRVGAQEEILLTLESQSDQPPEFEVDLPISAVHLSPAGAIVLAGENWLAMEAGGRLFRVSAGSFFQVNTFQAEALARHVSELLRLDDETTLLDVYCGVGFFSAFLAQQCARCIGIEASSAACEDYIFNLGDSENVELYIGAAEDVLPGLRLSGRVAAVVDPPRAGLEQRAMDALVEIMPQPLVYVSCDPATLARDLKKLCAAGYRLERVTPFDMFPHTYHIECVAVLTRAAGWE